MLRLAQLMPIAKVSEFSSVTFYFQSSTAVEKASIKVLVLLRQTTL